MQTIQKQLVLLKDDYEIMVSYLKGGLRQTSFDRHNAEELQVELKKARVVDKEEFPLDVVRLNSRVMIMEKSSKKILELVVVTPDQADIGQRKVSVLAPIGTALIGFKKGQTITWPMPSGKKTFRILEVIN